MTSHSGFLMQASSGCGSRRPLPAATRSGWRQECALLAIVECEHLALVQGGGGGSEVAQHMASQPCAHLSADFNSHRNSHLLQSISYRSPSTPHCTHKMPPRGKRRNPGTPSPRKRPTKKAREGRNAIEEEHLPGGALRMRFPVDGMSCHIARVHYY